MFNRDRYFVYLQKANYHQNKTIWSNATGPHFIQIALQQKLLEHHSQVAQTRVLIQILFDQCRTFDAIYHVEADIDAQVGFGLGYFDYGHGSLVENFYVISISHTFSD